MLAAIARKRAANPEKAYTGNTVLAVQMRTPTLRYTNNVVYDVLPMTCGAVRALPCR